MSKLKNMQKKLYIVYGHIEMYLKDKDVRIKIPVWRTGRVGMWGEVGRGEGYSWGEAGEGTAFAIFVLFLFLKLGDEC